ncbi:hypothetical protein KBTX_02464 [wastewater metagenome]|uniref:Uncharacterized protein n=2 Tax=unclassified sequences TaxID=12908 RepID=A0A5B8RF40_9ZZZZ|nr:hypothetical protein [Arhodomonas sp. KWT]QEA06134.1 hypothetical protein KBTEX_02464 [uncultured organism]
MSVEQRAPQPGDAATIGERPERFTVISLDGGTVVLESRHGVRCRAGRRVVRVVDGERRQ